MPAAGYNRKIYINGRQYQTKITSCNFAWNDDVGCVDASLEIPAAAFDDFLDMEYGDKVDIRYGSAKSTRWWGGTISEITSGIGKGLSIHCNGFYTLLDEIRPTGRFGYLVTTATPANLVASDSSTGGTIPAGTYDYKVTSVDAKGETAASSADQVILTGSTSSVEVSWDAAQGATGYRLYRKKSTDSDWVYWTVSETTFTDTNGTTGTTISAPPSATTATEATIADNDIESVVNYLLDTFLTDDLSKGTVDVGGDVDLDDYDLTNSSGSLREVLQTLAKIAGDAMSYVDEYGAVHFTLRGDPETDSVPNKHKFVVGKSGGELIGSVANAARKKTKDGSPTVIVEGEDALSDEDQADADLAADDISDIDDGTIHVNLQDYLIAKRWVLGANPIAAKQLYGNVQDVPFLSPVSKNFFLENDNVTRKSISSGDLKKYMQIFPALWKLYRGYQWPANATENFTIAVIVYCNRQLAKMKGIRYDVEVTYDDTDTDIRLASTSRLRPLEVYAPGVKTWRTSMMVAGRETIQKPAMIDSWSIDIESVTQVVRPGLDIIQFTSRKGSTYKLRVSSASYSFDDDPSVTLQCGDKETNPDQENEMLKKKVTKIGERNAFKGVWRPANSSILIP